MGNCFKKPEPAAPPPPPSEGEAAETVTVEETVAEVKAEVEVAQLPGETVPPPPGEVI